jgi:hypothetical protein
MAQTTRRTSIPDDAHEWVSFDDPEEDRTWVFDVTFLLSSWTCIFGAGCQGVLTGPAPEMEQGCCSYGAHFTDTADRKRVEAAAKKLTPEQWQFHRQGHQRGVTKRLPDGDWGTRLVQDACIFLNRPGFDGGAGCALHRAALEKRQRPLDWKPDVCWQLPLRRDEDEGADGHVTTTVGEWKRRHWGAGGEEFHWWCTEAPEAFTAREPVYRTMRDELRSMVGARVYRMLTAYLDERAATKAVPLPHPTSRATGANGAR